MAYIMGDVDNQKYEFFMESDVFGLSNLPLKAFLSIGFKDSIFNFYPSASVTVQDSAGIITDNIYFIEGLDFDVELFDTNTNESIGGLYSWANNEVNNTQISDYIQGDITFALIHNYLKLDKPSSLGWKDTISNIVKNIISKNFNHYNYNYIEETTGIQTHYQMNKLSGQLISELCNIAYSSNSPKSPFYTFINNKGELYFMSMKTMMDQKPVATYNFVEDESMIRDDCVKSVFIDTKGLSISKYLYTPRIYNIDKSGNEIFKEFSIKDFYYNIDGKHKLLIRKSDVGDVTQVKHVGQIGKDESEFYKGLINNLYTGVNSIYRMGIIVDFNSNAVAGKTIELNVNSSDVSKGKGTEHCGKWLIYSSQTVIDGDATAYTKLDICRGGIPIDPTHPLKNDFVS